MIRVLNALYTYVDIGQTHTRRVLLAYTPVYTTCNVHLLSTITYVMYWLRLFQQKDYRSWTNIAYSISSTIGYILMNRDHDIYRYYGLHSYFYVTELFQTSIFDSVIQIKHLEHLEHITELNRTFVLLMNWLEN